MLSWVISETHSPKNLCTQIHVIAGSDASQNSSLSHWAQVSTWCQESSTNLSVSTDLVIAVLTKVDGCVEEKDPGWC
jgi:hypothetical protein